MKKTATRASLIIAALTLSLGLAACGGSGSDNYCKVAKDEFAKFDVDSAIDLSDFSSYGQFADAFDAVAKVAPDDVKADFESVAQTMKKIADSDGDMTAIADLAEEATEMQAASTRIETSLKETCDFDPGVSN